MKLSTKIILPIILISALLILLNGCFGVPADEEPGVTEVGTSTITGIIAAPCCNTSGEPASENSGSPDYWCYWCEKDWFIQEGVEVILTSGQEEIATTTTDKFGKYTFTGVPPGENYVITAYCPDDTDIPLVKDVVPELAKSGSFDAGTTDLVSTSLGLVVDYVTYFAAWDPEDISLDKVIAAKPDFPGFPKFRKLIREVRRVLEDCEDVDADVELLLTLCKAAEEVSESDMGCAPGYAPEPEPEVAGAGPEPEPEPTVSISLTKTVIDEECYTPEGTLVYTLTVTNTGEVVLTNVTLTDGLLGIDESRGTLVVGDSWTENCNYVVPPEQTGTLTNTAEVSGTGNGQTVSATASVSLLDCAIPEPGIELTKTADVASAGIGDTITYSYEVENTGNVTLTAVSAIDDLLGSVTLDKTTLAPGDIATGTLTYEVVEGDLPGPIVNTVNAEGTYGPTKVDDSVSASVTLSEAAPAIYVIKTADVASAGIGDTITYSYEVENTGNVTLTAVSAIDDLLGSVTLDKTTLAPGDIATGTLTYEVVEGDLPGPIVNTVNAEGTYGPTKVDDSVSASVTLSEAAPAIYVIKTADVASAGIGDTITYSYEVENTGNVTLTAVSAIDDLLGSVTLDKTTLAPGDIATGTLTYEVVEGDLPGPIVNTVNAEGTYGPTKVDDSVSASVTLSEAAPAIYVIKTADVASAGIGDTITYSYEVENTGNVTLTAVSAIDDLLGSVTLDKTTLAPGDIATGTLTYEVVEGDLPGPIVNTVNAEGTYGPTKVDDSVSASVTLSEAAPAIYVIKTADVASAGIGDTITYSYEVENTGNVTLTAVSAIDDLLGSVTLDKTTLSPGDIATGTLTYEVVEGDLPGPIVNTVNAEGTYGPTKVDDSVSASVTLSVKNVITFIKLGGWNNPGCSPGFGQPHDPFSYTESEPVQSEIALNWLISTNPNLKSVHFFVNFADANTEITYRYTSDLYGLNWNSWSTVTDPRGVYSGPVNDEYSFSSDCIVVPEGIGSPPEYPTLFYIEISVNGENNYMIKIYDSDVVS